MALSAQDYAVREPIMAPGRLVMTMMSFPSLGDLRAAQALIEHCAAMFTAPTRFSPGFINSFL